MIDEKKRQKRKEIDLARCSKCNSSLTYVRISDMTRVCRNCGNIQEIFVVKEIEKPEENKEGEKVNG